MNEASIYISHFFDSLSSEELKIVDVMQKNISIEKKLYNFLLSQDISISIVQNICQRNKLSMELLCYLFAMSLLTFESLPIYIHEDKNNNHTTLTIEDKRYNIPNPLDDSNVTYELWQLNILQTIKLNLPNDRT